MSLIKSQLIQNITEANPHLFVRDVERIVNTIFNEITNSLAEGKRVELRGFGLIVNLLNSCLNYRHNKI